MTEVEFIAKYKNLITIYFDFDELNNNSNITIDEYTRHISDFLEFYIPRYAKNNEWDNRHINQIAQDNDSTILQLKDIIASPADWGLPPFKKAYALSKQLWPVPIATPTSSGKTLILDSNHTICTLLMAGIDMEVPCIELSGVNLSDACIDLRLMTN